MGQGEDKSAARLYDWSIRKLELSMYLSAGSGYQL